MRGSSGYWGPYQGQLSPNGANEAHSGPSGGLAPGSICRQMDRQTLLLPRSAWCTCWENRAVRQDHGFRS